MRTPLDNLFKNTDLSALRGPRRKDSVAINATIKEIYDDNAGWFKRGLDNARAKAGTGKGTLPTELGKLNNEQLFTRLVKTRLGSDMTAISNAELRAAVEKTVKYDIFRSELQKSNFLGRFTSELGAPDDGRQKGSQEWQDFKKATGYKGNARDFANLTYDDVNKWWEYEGTDGKIWKLWFGDSPEVPMYQEL